MRELLPCPFCGGEPAFGHIHYAKSHEAWWQDGSQIRDAAFVSCVSCGISNQGMFGHQTEADAATAWNTRADIRDRLTARVAELEAALDECAEWMKWREKMIPGVPRICDRARAVLGTTNEDQ